MASFSETINNEYDTFMNVDKAAKAAGTLIGRVVREQIADGYAHYKVVSHNTRTAILEHIDWCDGWTIPFVENMGCKVPLKYVRANIEHRDKIDVLFSGNLTVKPPSSI